MKKYTKSDCIPGTNILAYAEYDPATGQKESATHILCDCGRDLELWDSNNNECDCGRLYNGGGQQVMFAI